MNWLSSTVLNRQLYDDALAIEEAGALTISRRLAKEEGIWDGTSTGLNVVAAIELAKQLGPGRVVVTVACDSGLKYVRGDLFTAEREFSFSLKINGRAVSL